MKSTKIIITLFLLALYNISFGQKYYGQIITQKNDTLNVEIKLDASSFNVNRLIYLQDKISVVQKKMELL